LLLPIDSDFSPGYECEIEFTRRSGALGFNLNIPTPNGDSPIYFDPPGEGGVFIRKNWGKYEQLAEQTNIKNGERRTASEERFVSRFKALRKGLALQY